MFQLDPEKDLDLISANAGNDDRRVQQLRQLLLSQLDLIQKQSEVIVAKDQQIKEIKKENERLLKKVATLPSSAVAKTSTNEKSNKKTKVVVKKESIETEIKQEKEVKVDSEASEESHDGEDNVEDMETEEPYFTLQNEIELHKVDDDHDLKVDVEKAQVPGWRLKPITPSYIMEGTENIEDETILKRHQKPELDEKRRKRWDVQHLREQRNVARLKARYDPNEDQLSLGPNNFSSKLMPLNAESSKDFSSLTTLIPDPEEAEEIVVQEKLPVSVFGCVLPNLGMQEFSLPWLA